MSALGQKRTFCDLDAMSALPRRIVFLVQWEAAMEVAVRALVIASGVVLTVGSIATAMPMAYQPHLWQDTIQIHGCHRGYNHDLGGWHRHDKDCQRLRGAVRRKSKSQERSYRD